MIQGFNRRNAALKIGMILGLTWLFLNPIKAQDLIRKQVEENQKALEEKRKREEAIKKRQEDSLARLQAPPPPPEKDEVDPIVSGRKILSYVDTLDDLPSYYDRESLSATEPEKADLPPAVMDTAAFLERSARIKLRDMQRFQQGLPFPLRKEPAYTKWRTLLPEVQVFAWHPHWMGEEALESYNFSLLSMVAYFSYELNPVDGSYTSIHNWLDTKLISKAQGRGCKVLLSVSNFGEENNRKFFSNPAARQNCVKTLVDLVEKRSADGVHLDFEQIPVSERDNLIEFISFLGSMLKSRMNDAVLTMSLPPLDPDYVYDLPILSTQVDFFIMNSGEYYGEENNQAGPIAPLKGGDPWMAHGIETSLDYYLATGIDPKKMIVTFSYYGKRWQTNSLKVGALAQEELGYPLYREILENKPQVLFEPTGVSAYNISRSGNDNLQIWFEDTTSLGQKYDWVVSRGIGGAGIWALGYDNGQAELWELLGNKFAEPLSNKKTNISYYLRVVRRAQSVLRNPKRVLSNPTYVLRMFGILTGVSMIGYFSLLRFGCRMSRGANMGLKGGIIFIVILAVIFGIIGFNQGFSGQTRDAMAPYISAGFLLGGFILGIIVFLLLSRRFLSEKELP